MSSMNDNEEEDQELRVKGTQQVEGREEISDYATVELYGRGKEKQSQNGSSDVLDNEDDDPRDMPVH